MARSRNIKPGFFQNDELSELEPIDRLFFIGLWTVCDFKGCIEYRPKKLKAQILPYDDIDISTIATNLDKSGFIRLYSVQGKDYLKVVNFSKHQNPHKNERAAGSETPDFNEDSTQAIDSEGVTINRDKDGTAQDCDGTDRADSLNLIPDSLNPIKKNGRFTPPTQSEAASYFLEKGSMAAVAEAETFINHFTSNGWKVGGKGPMKCWKAAIRNWIKRGNESKPNQPANTIDLLTDRTWAKELLEGDAIEHKI